MKKFKYSLAVFLSMAVIGPVLLDAGLHNIAMVNFAFSPDTLVVFQNDTVLWVNQGSVNHTTTSGVGGVPDGIWDSGLMAPDDSFMFHFTTIGDYPYYCTPHWQMGMIGLISVVGTNVEETKPVQNNMPLAVTYSTMVRTGVDFTIDAKGARGIRLNIYDARGSLVWEISKTVDNRETGVQTIRWDMKDAQGQRAMSGAYFFRIIADGKASSGKLILVE